METVFLQGPNFVIDSEQNVQIFVTVIFSVTLRVKPQQLGLICITIKFDQFFTIIEKKKL
jgi:hypothetical protein